MARLEPTSPVTPLAPSPKEPPRSRSAEFYGFVALTSTSILFVVYVLWALLPDEYIVWLGIEWYPSREWALLLPAYSIVLVLLTYFTYFSLALTRTPALSDVSAIIDSRAHLPPLHVTTPYLKHADPHAIPEVYDIPIGVVNRVLYTQRKKNNTLNMT
ncbi:PIG-P-domain-containing protein [Phlebopus sp. FC_14]|nr:PIG-P-domain-containing protein [Phlebopus sp. FC_14]